MYKNIDRLIEAWAKGHATDGERCGNVSTDYFGYDEEAQRPAYCDLRSYRQVIARRFWPTTRGGEAVPTCFAVVTDKWSVTTSKHTSKAWKEASWFIGYGWDDGQRLIRLPQFAILRSYTIADALVMQDMGRESGAIK
jgi:hypothetical protein